MKYPVNKQIIILWILLIFFSLIILLHFYSRIGRVFTTSKYLEHFEDSSGNVTDSSDNDVTDKDNDVTDDSTPKKTTVPKKTTASKKTTPNKTTTPKSDKDE
jgi:hypothetical protein